MHKVTFYLLLSFLVLNFIRSSYAQESFKTEIPTGKVNKKVKDKRNPAVPWKKEIQYIYVGDANRMLIGNPCAIAFTRTLGFEYELWHMPEKRYGSLFEILFHNAWIKTKLTFTKGPLWRIRVKQQFDQCRIRSGDFKG